MQDEKIEKLFAEPTLAFCQLQVKSRLHDSGSTIDNAYHVNRAVPNVMWKVSFTNWPVLTSGTITAPTEVRTGQFQDASGSSPSGGNASTSSWAAWSASFNSHHLIFSLTTTARAAGAHGQEQFEKQILVLS